MKTCQHCDHTGDDVVTRIEHVGGLGEVPVTECKDRKACWDRWDKQNSDEKPPKRNLGALWLKGIGLLLGREE